MPRELPKFDDVPSDISDLSSTVPSRALRRDTENLAHLQQSLVRGSSSTDDWRFRSVHFWRRLGTFQLPKLRSWAWLWPMVWIGCSEFGWSDHLSRSTSTFVEYLQCCFDGVRIVAYIFQDAVDNLQARQHSTILWQAVCELDDGTRRVLSTNHCTIKFT